MRFIADKQTQVTASRIANGETNWQDNPIMLVRTARPLSNQVQCVSHLDDHFLMVEMAC